MQLRSGKNKKSLPEDNPQPCKRHTNRNKAEPLQTPQQTILSGPAIGIDLGTTYSCVGFFRNGQVEIIPNDQGNRTTPSWVAFTEESEILVGEAAKNQAVRNSVNTIYDAKRLIGRAFSEDIVQKDLAAWPFKVIGDSHNNPRIQVTVADETKAFSPEEISAYVLRYMKRIAEEYLGEPVQQAVITVPAYFNDAQRQATKEAARIAGLHVLRIINEPTAAALAYGLAQTDKRERHIVVFDTGGGTHDISALAVEEDFFQVKATGGNTHLGGQDFDQRLFEYLVGQFRTEFKKKTKREPKQDFRLNPRAVKRLLLECERAKRVLSSSSICTIELDSLHEGFDFYTSVSRAKFEDLCSDLFRQCLQPLQTVLDDAKLPREKIHDVVLVGGSTRIPRIQQLLSEFFGGKELCKSINPDEAVAYGAAVQAAILTGIQNEKIDDVVLVDVLPLSVGVEVHGNLMNVMIPRNTAIPTKRSEMFSTFADDQEIVTIKIFEGERALTRDNHPLGVFHLTGIPKMQRGAPRIQVTFEVDADSILKVTAANKDGDLSGTLVIRHDENRLSKDDIEKMVAEAKEHAGDDDAEAERIERRTELESYLYNVSVARPTDVYFHDYLEQVYTWLEENGDTGTVDDFNAKLQEVEDRLLQEDGEAIDENGNVIVEGGGTAVADMILDDENLLDQVLQTRSLSAEPDREI